MRKRLRCLLLGHQVGYTHLGRPYCQRCGVTFRYATAAEHEHARRFIR